MCFIVFSIFVVKYIKSKSQEKLQTFDVELTMGQSSSKNREQTNKEKQLETPELQEEDKKENVIDDETQGKLLTDGRDNEGNLKTIVTSMSFQCTRFVRMICRLVYRSISLIFSLVTSKFTL